jgi:hypothetical protein
VTARTANEHRRTRSFRIAPTSIDTWSVTAMRCL